MNIKIAFCHVLTTLILLFITGTTSAQDIYAKAGLVKGIYSFDSTAGADLDHVTIEGFTADLTNNKCGVQDGLVAVVLRDNKKADRHLSILLAAQATGLPVRVRVDADAKNTKGNCYLWFIEPAFGG